MDVLAIDPGTKSGYALIRDSDVIASDEFRIDSAKGVARIMDIMSGHERQVVVVIEAVGYVPKKAHYATLWSLGRMAGKWEMAAQVNGLEVHWMHPRTWQRAMLDASTKTKREELKRLSVFRASAEIPGDPGENEADAINLGQFVARELRLGRTPWEK
jgi:hypothetical protein